MKTKKEKLKELEMDKLIKLAKDICCLADIKRNLATVVKDLEIDQLHSYRQEIEEIEAKIEDIKNKIEIIKNKRSEKEILLCTHKGCIEIQTEDGEFCKNKKHFKY